MKNKNILIVIGILIIAVILVVLFMSNKLSPTDKTPEFVKNFDLKKDEGLFRCLYKYDQEDYQEVYTVKRTDLTSFGGAQDYYSADKKLLFSNNWVDYKGLSLDGIATNCINTVYNEDGTVTQDLCTILKLGVECDREPIYTNE